MLCPFCNCENSKVLESRTTTDKSSIRRRRECESCSKRFTTYERVEKMPVAVTKSNGNREDFSRDKFINSIKLACHKSKISAEEIEHVVNQIENELANIGRRDVSTSTLAKLALDHLLSLDKVAYLRYCSIYQQFNTVEDFIMAIKEISKD